MDGGIIKGHEETLEGDENYVHFLDCNDYFKGIYNTKVKTC